MNRKALIIGIPGDGIHAKKLAGVDVDLNNYFRFLSSPLGGSWTEQEIRILRNPAEALLARELQNLDHVDYAFVAYSGHGGHDTSTRTTHIQLENGEMFDSQRMLTDAPKQTLVLDCFRDHYTPSLLKSILTLEHLAKVIEPLDLNRCRAAFDAHLKACSPAIITLNACASTELAGDRAEFGGLYSSSLIEVAEEFGESPLNAFSPRPIILDVPTAHEHATGKVHKTSKGLQNPKIDMPRARTYFPFAVIA
ncbi:MAG TPA: caspase family protein [Dyella sp.]|uniref:caspase family protein n=1 Tax=Dyella sp. TaxID=1869338 RepID=UPI002D12B2C3|nr:caspase family protein [Dyella sp.]HTV84362.1 caspase family protein [Dyella sp.]